MDETSFFSFSAPPVVLASHAQTTQALSSVFDMVLPIVCLSALLFGSRLKTPRGFLSFEDQYAPSLSVSSRKGPRVGMPKWKLALLELGGALEAAIWTCLAAERLMSARVSWTSAFQACLLAVVWIITTVTPLLRPSPTPVYSILFFHISAVLSSSAVLLNYVYDLLAHGGVAPFPVLYTTNGVVAALLVGIQLSLPVGILPESSELRPPGIGGRSPEDECSLWSWLTFSFMNDLFNLGWSKTLTEEEVWTASPGRTSDICLRVFQEDPHPSLFFKVFFLNRRDLLVDFVCSVTSIFLNYAAPFFLKRVLDAIDNPSPERIAAAYLYAGAAMGASFLKAVIYAIGRRAGTSGETRTRSMLMAAIYAKALLRKDFSGVVSESATNKKPTKNSLKPQATGADIGKIVSMMSNDATRVANRITQASELYGPPIEIVIASIFLYQILGLSAFAGSIALVLVWPLNSWLRNQAVVINKNTVEVRDKRMTIMNEIVLSIKLIKFLAWERQWTKRAMDARDLEMKHIISGRTNALLSGLVWGLSPILVMLISFFCFITLGKGELTVPIAFTSLSLYNMLAGPLSAIPAQLTIWAQSRLALDRISHYFDEPEVPDFVSSLREKSSQGGETLDSRLGIENGVFRWNVVEKTVKPKDEAIFELGELSVIFPEGELTVVSGPVGSGKTALLLALLGEIECIHGQVFLPKTGKVLKSGELVQSVAYCSQNPFLQMLSIKDNILFGAPLDESRYRAVVHACALEHDFRILEDGDETLIGIRGVVMSGGQRARIALARALYSPAATVLLDDPLAAVDVGTALHLYQHALKGPLLRGRTVVLVSHHVELLLPGAHSLLRMLDGRIELFGSVEELRARGDLPQLLKADAIEGELKEELKSERTDEEAAEVEGSGTITPAEPRAARKLHQAEERSSSNVSSRIYALYIKTSGYGIWALIILLLTVGRGTGILSQFWLKEWGDAYKSDDGIIFCGIHLPSARQDPVFYLIVYGAISILALFISLIQVVAAFVASYRSARELHNRLLITVIRSSPRWFDTTPGGRILNRFSADIASLDGSLSGTLRQTLSWTANAISALILVVSVEPWFTIPALFLAAIYFRFATVYRRTSRDLRRMLATARSPLFAGFGEVLDGIVTLRAFSSEGRFLKKFEKDVDLLLSIFWFNWHTNRWLLLRFDCLGAAATFIATIFAIFWSVSAGSSAVAIVATQSFVSALYWLTRQLNAVELAFNAVERIDEYLNLNVQEPPYEIESNRPPAYWPSSTSGRPIIRVEDLEIKYAPDLPSVIHGISFEIKAGEKIGLTGRTASGKSTLALSFLRFTDPSAGRIIVDGIDITSIGVGDLRSNITYIPQDATLLSGTLREAIDPFNQSSDEELNDILRRVHLIPRSSSAFPSGTPSRTPSSTNLTAAHTGASLPQGTSLAGTTLVEEPATNVRITLDSKVSASGLNFSQGQRQLIAMARALLRNNNIVIMDEATASVDYDIDDKIQRTIREELKDATVITIAHRLSSVIDYTRLLVLDQGRIVEFDTPVNLLTKPDGFFAGMAKKSGKYDELLASAKKSSIAIAAGKN